MNVLLCDPDLVWTERLSLQLKQHGITVKIARELEELWCIPEETKGILVSCQELKSMLFWGETDRKEAVSKESYSSTIRSLCLQGKKVILIMPELNYETECVCLQAGASECIHKEQTIIHGNELAEKRDILLQVWGEQSDLCVQRLDTIIKQIRHKLNKFPIGIYTRYGKGYYLECEAQSDL